MQAVYVLYKQAKKQSLRVTYTVHKLMDEFSGMNLLTLTHGYGSDLWKETGSFKKRISTTDIPTQKETYRVYSKHSRT